MAKKYTEVGSIRMGDYGLYIKLHPARVKDSDGIYRESDAGLKDLSALLSNCGKGLNLTIEKPEDEIKRFVELGFIDEAEAEKRLSFVPEWKKYTIKLVTEK